MVCRGLVLVLPSYCFLVLPLFLCFLIELSFLRRWLLPGTDLGFFGGGAIFKSTPDTTLFAKSNK